MLPSRNYMQICWVVPDLEKAMAKWARQAGVGPFFYFDNVVYEDAVYRGKPWKPVKFIAGMAQAGEMQIELVQQIEDGPSMFQELARPDEARLHHMSTYTENYQQDLEHYLSQGVEVVFSGRMKGTPVCWLDTVDTLGFMTELMTVNPLKQKVFDMFRQAAAAWDGGDYIRRL